MFAGIKNDAQTKKALRQVLSFEYRKAAFELNLMGSDEVIRAMNAMQRAGQGTDSLKMMRKWGELLLAIRKDLGNTKTKIKPIEMLRSQITDIDQYLESQ